MALTSKQFLHLPPEMLAEMASGFEDPVRVAARYGYDQAAYDTLTSQEWFVQAVEAKRAELRRSGWTFKAKAALMAEDMLEETYLAAKQSDSVGTKLEVAKYLTKIADLEPRTNAPVASGPGFSITINLPNASAAHTTPPGATIDVTPEPEDTLGPPPKHLAFALDNDLLSFA
jgi:hypothetical protein